MKKYIEEHKLEIDPSQKKSTTSPSNVETRVTRSHRKSSKHETIERHENSHHERDMLVEEVSNEDHKMVEESSGRSSVTTRSSGK